MADFNIKSDSVDVEQIMRQVRERIREKRGVDYTDDQIRELANAKLDRFLDPSGVRSGLLEEFQRRTAPPPHAYEDSWLFESHNPIVRVLRRLLRPFLKLLFNSKHLMNVLRTQAMQQEERHGLYFEVIHNLVVEMTRMSIETKNLKMRVESLQGRLEFNERRARALEAVVEYKRDALSGARDEDAGTEPQGGVDPITGGDSLRTRRRRRRRGRRTQGSTAETGELREREAAAENGGATQASGSAEAPAHVEVRPGHVAITGRQGGIQRSPGSTPLADAGSNAGAAPDSARTNQAERPPAEPTAATAEGAGTTPARPPETGTHADPNAAGAGGTAAAPADPGSGSGASAPEPPRDAEPQ